MKIFNEKIHASKNLVKIINFLTVHFITFFLLLELLKNQVIKLKIIILRKGGGGVVKL